MLTFRQLNFFTKLNQIQTDNFIYLFKDTVSQIIQNPMIELSVNYERMRNEGAITEYKVLSHHLCGGTKGKQQTDSASTAALWAKI
jgi:hypothetical protein